MEPIPIGPALSPPGMAHLLALDCSGPQNEPTPRITGDHRPLPGAILQFANSAIVAPLRPRTWGRPGSCRGHPSDGAPGVRTWNTRMHRPPLPRARPCSGAFGPDLRRPVPRVPCHRGPDPGPDLGCLQNWCSSSPPPDCRMVVPEKACRHVHGSRALETRCH
jgi:hypothetical protein